LETSWLTPWALVGSRRAISAIEVPGFAAMTSSTPAVAGVSVVPTRWLTHR
jgi:hypothetical protein